MTTTLNQLAEKLNGKLWENGNKERVYLNRGHNTKKMKTTIYVELSPSGIFDVKCYIDCPSQPYSWIASQKEDVIESVEKEIKMITAATLYVVDDETFSHPMYAIKHLAEEMLIDNDWDDLKESLSGIFNKDEYLTKANELLNDKYVIKAITN